MLTPLGCASNHSQFIVCVNSPKVDLPVAVVPRHLVQQDDDPAQQDRRERVAREAERPDERQG